MKRLLVLALCMAFLFPLFETRACRIVPDPPIVGPRPQPVQAIQVQSHRVNIDIKNGVAETTLETVFYNPNPQVLEGTYLFPLPQGASISRFSMWIDGQEMPAELLDAKKARDLYISIVQRMIDPGLLEFVGRETFQMRIFPIPARGTKKIKLSYEEILPVDGNLMRYVYPLTTVGNGREDKLGQVSWQVNIESEIPIKSVFSPTHQVNAVKEENRAVVTFSGQNVRPERDFVLYVSRSDRNVDLSFAPYCKSGEDGYFLLMLSPKAEISEINPKDVVFILDTSGSMLGKKMTQAREALKYCLQSMRPEDRFNIVPFATVATPYRDDLLAATPENIQAALKFVEEDIYARGGTNIDEALGFAVDMAPVEEKRPYMVVFLTDGKPTIGVTEPDDIIARVQKAKCPNLRLFTFGIGERINTKLLDRLAEANRGTREYVSSDEDIEFKVSNFFDKVSSPVLSDIKIHFPSSSELRVDSVYPRSFSDLFKGAQITLLGRYKGSGDQAIRVTGVMGGKEREFVYEMSFPAENKSNEQIPRLWAVRKVGFLLDQIRLNGEDAELKSEVVYLAKRFGIVTPYTSYLVVEDAAPVPTTVRPLISDAGPRGIFPGSDRATGGGAPAPPATTAPAPFANREFRGARSEMQQSSGESAIKTSKRIRNMRDADVVDGWADDEGESPGSPARGQMRTIDEKTFYLDGEVWYDSQFYLVDAQKMEKVKVRFMSDEYLELLRDTPEMGRFLAIGSQVVLVWNDRIYEIYQ